VSLALWCSSPPSDDVGNDAPPEPSVQIKHAFDGSRKQVPPWKLLPGITQAVSSIAHAHNDTQVQIQRFVAGVAKAYPNQCLWMLFAVLNSANEHRSSAAKLVVTHVRGLVSDATRALMTAHSALCTNLMV
jgi:hypothetical protein